MTTTDIARPRFARMYLRSAASAEQRGASDHRRRLLEGLRGTVVEIGAGHGLNFPHYPPEVNEVIAIEPEPTLRSQAETAAESATVPIRVIAGVADELPVAETPAPQPWLQASCSARSPTRSTRSPRSDAYFAPTASCASTSTSSRCQPKRLLLQVIDRTGIWPTIAGGCHPARDTTEAIMQGGFDIKEIDRFGFSAQRFEPLIPHILGIARRT